MVERISRRHIPVQAKVAAVLALAPAALLAACGGSSEGDVQGGRTETPEPTPSVKNTQEPMPSATALATQVVETPSPTIAPTSEAIETSAKLKKYVEDAVDSFGSPKLPDPLQTIDDVRRDLSGCTEEGPIDVPPEAYGDAVIGSCGAVGQELRNMYRDRPTPEILTALSKMRDFTIAKIDQLAKDGKLPFVSNVEDYKNSVIQNSFTP